MYGSVFGTFFFPVCKKPSWRLYVCRILTFSDPDNKSSLPSATLGYRTSCFCSREDVASSSTFTLEDSAICLTSEQSTMDVDIDRDDGSVLDVYLVSLHSVQQSPVLLIHFIRPTSSTASSFFCPLTHSEENLSGHPFPPANHATITPLDGPSGPSTSNAARSISLPVLQTRRSPFSFWTTRRRYELP